MKKKIPFYPIISSIIIFLIFLIFWKITDKIISKSTGLGNPIIYSYSKIYGYELVPNQEVVRKDNKIKINNFGMRSNNDWNLKNENSILFIGDSVTYGGSIVSNQDLFSEKICKEVNLNKFTCGNLSANGYGLDAINKRIKYKSFNNEKILIIVLCGSDFIRGINHIGSQPFWGKKIDNFFPATTELFFFFYDKIRNKFKYEFGENNIYTETKIKYYIDLMEDLKLNLEKNNKPYLIIYTPELSELNGTDNYKFFTDYMNRNFKNFYNLKNEIVSEKNNIYADNLHLNKNGHKLYSKIISKKIIEIINN